MIYDMSRAFKEPLKIKFTAEVLKTHQEILNTVWDSTKFQLTLIRKINDGHINTLTDKWKLCLVLSHFMYITHNESQTLR